VMNSNNSKMRVTKMLTEKDLEHFRVNGWLLIHPFTDEQVTSLGHMIDEVQAFKEDGDWLHHYEMTDSGPKLCRTENFIPFHDGLRELLTIGVLPEMVGELLGEPVFLYKEKINYKLVGGAGFRPHQDAPAYPFIKKSISVMIAIDESNADNGCLEVCDAMHQELLPTDDGGCIVQQWTNTHDWHQVEMRAGDVLIFDALTPHRSGPNKSQKDRRAIFPTYNAQSEGDLRQTYYEEKLRVFNESTHTGENVRISLINDFEGKPVK
jgi:ectoine hydroxylase-related dioxygenase (phytanoyl-CoA dioxygenase family)